ncbi:MAG: hypothetical protein IAF02_20400, partial [Anaerolineae bacterium]|nr:hypothetical protein [Anaerolineae bacterium]
TSPDYLAQNLAALDPNVDPLLKAAVETAVNNLVPATASDVIFTDERAPVETIVDTLVLRYLLSEGPAGLPGLGQ